MPTIRGKSKHRKILIQNSKIPLSLNETNIYDHIDREIPRIFLEVIFGALLGDSNITKHKNKFKKAYHVCFGHCEKQLPYLEYKQELLSEQLTNKIRKDRSF